MAALPHQDESKHSSRRFYVMVLGFGFLALVAVFLDLPIARYCLAGNVSGDLRTFLTLSEAFSHFYGVSVIIIAVGILDPENWRRVPRLIACANLPGLTNLLLKISVARYRPSALNSDEFPTSVWETFRGWSLLITDGNFAEITDRSIQSFTSGHTATAVGLAIGLSWLYPRGRWLFASLAVFAALQRITSGAHFLSDTLAATALACLVSGFLIGDMALGRLFRRFERGELNLTRGLIRWFSGNRCW